MKNSDEFLKSVLAYGEASKAPKESLSPQARQAIKDALEQNFGPKLKGSAMRWVILKILREGTSTGEEIIDQLEGIRVRFEIKGAGAIFGLLQQMENDGVVERRFDDSTTITRYVLTEEGSLLLKRDGGAVFEGLGIAALLNPQ